MLLNLPWQIMLLHSFIFSKDLSGHCPSFRFTHNTAFVHDGITGVGCKTISQAPCETSHYPTSGKLFPFSIHTNEGKGYNSFGKMVQLSFRFDARTFYIYICTYPFACPQCAQPFPMLRCHLATVIICTNGQILQNETFCMKL